MTLQEYVDQLNRVLKDNPELGKHEVVYSSDDEGNSYHPVIFGPGLSGNYDKDCREFTSSQENKEVEVNAVCIN